VVIEGSGDQPPHNDGSGEDQSRGAKPLTDNAEAPTSGEAPDAAVPDLQLLSDAELRPTNDDVLRLMQDEHPPFAIDTSDALYGSAFLHYLLFDRYPFLLHRDLGLELDDEALVYNRYYRFTLFTGLYRARHGKDAGLDQEACHLLEQSGVQVDAALIQQIDDRVRSEVEAALRRS
jgi:hypothetical protein